MRLYLTFGGRDGEPPATEEEVGRPLLFLAVVATAAVYIFGWFGGVDFQLRQDQEALEALRYCSEVVESATPVVRAHRDEGDALLDTLRPGWRPGRLGS